MKSRTIRWIALTVALAAGAAEAQPPPPPFVLCEGPPPLGWDFCACELIDSGWEWVCDDDWGGGVITPPADPYRSRPKPTIIAVGAWQGLNRLQPDLRADRILRSLDRDGDGILSEGERVPFSDPGFPPSSSFRVLDLVLDQVNGNASSVVYATRTMGVYTGIDRNNDGLATGSNETRLALGANNPRDVPGASTVVTMDYRAFERLAPTRGLGNLRKVMGFENGDQCIYHLVDRNDDGDFADASERFNLFNAAGVRFGTQIVAAQNGWILNADVASGGLPSAWDATLQRAELAALDFVLDPLSPTGSFFYFASTLPQRTTQGSKHGLVYRAIDRNGNGSVNETGETNLFYDPTLAAPIAFPMGRILDIAALPGSLYVLQSNGPLGSAGRPLPTCWRLQDLDMDGMALSQGEATLVFTARSPDAIELEIFPFGAPEPGAAALPYGWSCTAQGSPNGPQHTASGRPVLGGPNRFQLFVGQAPAQAPAGLMIGISRQTYGFFSLPFDLAQFGQPGCWLLQSLDLTFPASTNLTGDARIDFGLLPADPALEKAELYTQWFVLDLGVNRLAWSNGMRFRFDF
ncbi:MAG: hypothetical protein H6833_11475 [Planctomycetes bacterium]|nr:hypothetical protein [Planctomycetota bacterium]